MQKQQEWQETTEERVPHTSAEEVQNNDAVQHEGKRDVVGFLLARNMREHSEVWAELAKH